MWVGVFSEQSVQLLGARSYFNGRGLDSECLKGFLRVSILHPRMSMYVLLCNSVSGALPALCSHRSGIY